MPATELSFRFWPVMSSNPKLFSSRRWSTNGRWRSIAVLVCVGFLSPCLGYLQGHAEVRRSLVKVYLHRDFAGVLHGDEYVPEIRVQEVIELQGVVIGPGTHVVSYVGSHWRALGDTRNAGRLQVQDHGGKRWDAELIGVDQRVSLALLRSPDLKAKPLGFGPWLEENGLWVVSVLGHNCKLAAPSVVRSTRDDLLPIHQLQLVAEPGLVEPCLVEGGLVANGNGQLIGIVERWQSHPFSTTMRVSTVLSGEVVRSSVEGILEQDGDLKAGWLGIGLERQEKNLRVAKVLPGSPAEQAGLLEGDLIVAIASRPVQHRGQLFRAVRWRGAGQRLDLSVQRGDEIFELAALLTERQDRDPMVSWRLKMPRRWRRDRSPDAEVMVERAVLPAHVRLGVVVEDMVGREEGGIPVPDGGLVVREVIPDSPAGREGFQIGDILLKVNGARIASPADLKGRLNSTPDPIMILLVRNGKQLTKRISLR